MTTPSTEAIRDLIRRASALEKAGEMAKALEIARRAFEAASGEPALQASAGSCLAYLHNHLGRFDEALIWAQRAVDLVSEDRPTRAEALLIRGICLSDLGELETTEASLLEAMELARESGARHTLQHCLHVLSAGVYIPRGNFELALAADHESLEMAEALGLEDQLWFPLVTLGWVYWIQGRIRQAEDVLQRLSLVVQPYSLGQGYYFCLAGDLAQEGNETSGTPELYAKARSIADIIGDPGLGAELRVGLSRFHRRYSNVATALGWARDALKVAERAHSSPTLGWAMIETAQCLMTLGRLQEADELLKKAETHARKIGARFDLARILLLRASLHYQQDRGTAGRYWTAAIEQIYGGGFGFLVERERSLVFPLLKAFGSSPGKVGAASAKMLKVLEQLPPPPLHIRCLGVMEICQGGRMLSPRSMEKRRAGDLFQLLVISPGHRLQTDRVIEMLWPGKDPSTGAAKLHQASSTLRRALEADLPERFPSRYLHLQSGWISLDLPEGSTVDFEEFEAFWKKGEYCRALDLYRGDLLSPPNAEDHFIILRESLKQKTIQAAIKIAGRELAAGHNEEALEACLRALRLEPWHEQAVLIGMQALWALKQRAAAIRLYRQLSQRLQDELGVQPGEEVREYYRSIASE